MITNLSRKKPISIISMTSGKGGVGKTSMTCNLAWRFAQLGKKVLILDGDFGMANVDIFFGVRAGFNFLNVVRGEKRLQEVLVSPQTGIYIIPGGSGIYELNQLNHFERRNIFDQILEIQSHFDYLLIDTAPGIADNVLYLNAHSQICNVIITPDPSSFADSYALIKVLRAKYQRKNFSIICNQVKNNVEGLQLFQKFTEVCDQFLDVHVDYVGAVPFDDELRMATNQQRLILKHSVSSPAVLAIKQLAAQVEEKTMKNIKNDSWNVFWEQTIGLA